MNKRTPDLNTILYNFWVNHKIESVVLMFLIWRIVDLLLIFIANKLIPYLGFFPYKEQLITLHKPVFLTSLANFDGINYIVIATQRYHQYIQAFFPLYPLLIKIFTYIFLEGLISGLFISNISFLIGLIYLIKYLELIKKPHHKSIFYFVLLLLVYPTSFFFGSVYTEGLFFLLFFSCIYYLEKRNYLFVVLLSIALSLTKLIGILMLIPIFFHILKNNGFIKKMFFLLGAPFIGLILYSSYLFKTTGDPLFFYNVQPVFGANRSNHIILFPQVIYRYLKILFTAQWNFQYFISFIELVVFITVLIIGLIEIVNHLKIRGTTIKIVNYERIGLAIFSLVNIIIPSLTGTLSSIPRYSLMSFSIFIYLSELKNRKIKLLLTIIYFIFHTILFSYFVRGYFVS